MSKAARRKQPHPNAALIKDLRDSELRACYRDTFGKDPGQMGKDKMIAAFLEHGAPRARVPASVFVWSSQERHQGWGWSSQGLEWHD